MLLEQMAEAAHRLAPEIDPDEIAHYPRIVERFLDRRVRQVEPLLQKVYSQHPLDPDWRTAVARLRIKRLDQPTQRRPRHYPLHLGQKRCPSRRLGIALKSRGRQRQLLHPQPYPPIHPATIIPQSLQPAFAEVP